MEMNEQEKKDLDEVVFGALMKFYEANSSNIQSMIEEEDYSYQCKNELEEINQKLDRLIEVLENNN